MKSSMVKQKHVDGFTLIEMLLVLVIIAFCLMLFPMTMHNPIVISKEMEILRERLLLVQAKAMKECREIKVTLEGDTMRYDDTIVSLSLVCDGAVTFHPNGNVNHAMSIPCKKGSEHAILVIQLGSGRMYVKE